MTDAEIIRTELRIALSHSVILALLTPEEYKALEDAHLPYSGSTGAGAKPESYDGMAPYIATFLRELPRAMEIMGWTGVANPKALAAALEAQQKAERERDEAKRVLDDCIRQNANQIDRLVAEQRRLSGQVEELGRDNWIDACVRDVAELPDRDSPDGWPEAMLVTGPELKAIIRERVAAIVSTLPADLIARGRELLDAAYMRGFADGTKGATAAIDAAICKTPAPKQGEPGWLADEVL